MKIHYVAAYMADFPSDKANSIHVMRMCEAFASMGHEVVLYVRKTVASPSAIFDFYGVQSTFEIVQLESSLPKLNRVEHCYQAIKMARRVGCDMVISRTAIAAYFGIRRSLRVVFDAHGPIWERNIVERLCFRWLRSSVHLHKMTVNSRALKELYVQAGLVPRSGIIVAHNGAAVMGAINMAAVRLRGRSDVMQVGYTGHLYNGRGIDIIIECAKLLPDCEFHIVGGNAKDVEKWCSRSPLPNMHYYGFVKPSLVASYIAHFDVLLAPYQKSGVSTAGGTGDTSAFMNPIKIMEYVASSRAIVASDLPALREVLPGDAALFAVPDSVTSWVSCIQRLRDINLRDNLISVCRTLAKSVSWEVRARRMIE